MTSIRGNLTLVMVLTEKMANSLTHFVQGKLFQMPLTPFPKGELDEANILPLFQRGPGGFLLDYDYSKIESKIIMCPICYDGFILPIY